MLSGRVGIEARLSRASERANLGTETVSFEFPTLDIILCYVFSLTYSIYGSLKLYKFMYNSPILGNGLFLKRKKSVFEEYMNLSGH